MAKNVEYINDIKPGTKTTEFWLTLIAVLVGVAIEMHLFGDGSTTSNIFAYVGQVLAVYGYSYSRGMAKQM